MIQKRKTKIVCTMGPRLFELGLIKDLIDAGMDVARFNFSHDTHENHLKRYNELRAMREQMNAPIATMLDTKGPELRLGQFSEGKVSLTKGQLFTICMAQCEGTNERVSISYNKLVEDVAPGVVILIDDGLVGMEVVDVKKDDIICRVLNDGIISNNKGVNIPGVHVKLPFISKKDREDILFAIRNDFDFIAASFTRSAKDILEIREIFSQEGCTDINIIAKIENMQGVNNIDEIIRVSDGIMVARGDMGVEIPLEDVPVMQKMIIKKAYNQGKQVITATQMLDSMMKNPRPTRAEATDVANAIFDGTSATMLSGETAAGLYPVESVQTMARIALRAEEAIDYVGRFKKRESNANNDVTSAISHATCTSAHDLKAAAIIPVTKLGGTARMISKFRPNCPIIACTTNEKVRRQLNLSWGVTPLCINEEKNTDDLFEHAVDAGLKAGLIHDGELVVMTAGVPLGISGTTNLMKVHVVGHILVTGAGITQRQCCAELCVAHTAKDAEKNFRDGCILVMKQTDNSLLSYVRKASGLIIEESDPNGHGAIAAMTLDIPAIIGAKNATDILKSGAVVTLDADRGVVSCNRETEKL